MSVCYFVRVTRWTLKWPVLHHVLLFFHTPVFTHTCYILTYHSILVSVAFMQSWTRWTCAFKFLHYVLQMVDTEREMMDTLRSRQKRWLGRVLRHDSLLRTTLEGRIQGEKVVEDQEQCSWIGYWRRRKIISVMMNWRCWHKTDQDGVSEDGNLPHGQNTTAAAVYS